MNRFDKLSPHYFNQEMNKITETFGNAFYKNNRRELIYKWCNDLTERELTKIINFFIETKRSPPLPIEFRDESYRAKRNRPHDEKAQPVQVDEPQINCGVCCDSGVLVFKHFDHGVKAIACACPLRDDHWELPSHNDVNMYGWDRIDEIEYFKSLVDDHGFDGAVKLWRNIARESCEFWSAYETNN